MDDADKIAIVGLACRFPGAASAAQYWANLRAGQESISRFTVGDVIAAGVAPAVARDAHYVAARGLFSGGELFDWRRFGYSRAEAVGIDPQHRVLLETAANALDDAAVDPARFPGLIGMFAGCDAVLHPPSGHDSISGQIGYDKDFLATRVAYKLGLRGPALTVQAACATSLVATHLAAQSLLNYECDLALAGGVGLELPETVGYLYEEGSILAPDGHCRPFDAAAAGTVPGSGVGIVVLRRLPDALASGDRIIAVIRGSAVNNDGAEKIGYTAPAMAGQREVLRAAFARADIDARDLSYIEAHGTGTKLGDPIELAALTAAFRDQTDAVGFCRIGSVKSNIGHANSAAGVAGLIKTAMMLQRREFVPSLNFTAPNPQLHLDSSPFQICTQTAAWPSDRPVLAGVSSFGIGGVNSHAVLEAAPERLPRTHRSGPTVLLVSAGSASALALARSELAEALQEQPAPALDEVSWTLAAGRPQRQHRIAVYARDRDEAVAALQSRNREGSLAERPKVAFLFPGQGTLRAGSGAAAYARLPGFRDAFDRVGQIVQKRFGIDLLPVLDPATSAAWLLSTSNQQLGLFALGYGLAEQWRQWGVEAAAMLGHSSGEYVAAAVAGIWSLEDALNLVHERAKAMRTAPAGRMVAVAGASATQLELAAAIDQITVAVSGPDHVVFAGPQEQVELLQARLTEAGVAFRTLQTAHAFHSPAMRSAAEALRQAAGSTPVQPARIPYVSNLTGDWAAPPDADYWAAQLCRPVLLGQGMTTLLDAGCEVFLELGPGDSMARSLMRHPSWDRRLAALSGLGGAPDREDEVLQRTLGAAWERGLPVPETVWFGAARPNRCELPPQPSQPDHLPFLPGRTSAVDRVVPEAAAAPAELTAAAWTEVPASANALADLDAVAVPAGSDAEALQQLADAAPGPLIVVGREPADGFEAQPGRIALWAAWRRRIAPHAPVHVLDPGPEPGPLQAPVLRPTGAFYAYRAGRWWAHVDLPVALSAPGSGSAGPEGFIVASGEASAAEALMRAGLPVARWRGPSRPALTDPATALDRLEWTEAAARLSADPQLRAALNDYALASAARFLFAEGELASGEPVSWQHIRRRLTQHERFLDAVVAMLVEHRLLHRSAEQVWADPSATARIEAGIARRAELTEVEGVAQLLDHCIGAYAEVFTGTRDALSVLYPDGQADLLSGFMADNRLAADDSGAALQALTAAVVAQTRPDRRPLRILEVGAGTGALAWRLLETLTEKSTVEYHFTDISPLQVRRAAEHCAARGWQNVRCTTFDMTRDPREQGLVPGSYDVVLGYNVVHVAPSIRAALRNLGELVSDGGWLGLVEVCRVEPWTHLVWGLAPGWWDFADDRTDSLHLDRERWPVVLAESGYLQVAIGASDTLADHLVILARPVGVPLKEMPVVALSRDDLGREGGAAWVVTEDPPREMGWAAEQARYVHSRRDLWQVQVSDLAAALPDVARALGRRDLPPVVRWQAVHKPAEPVTPVEPTTQTRAAPKDEIAAIWCEVLGVDAVEPGDGFFDLGGDSLIAVHLMAQIREATGMRLPLTDFVPDATFANLVRLADQARAPRPANLVVFDESGTAPPLFFVAPGAGSSLCYRGLAKELGSHRPLYGLETPGLHDGRTPFTRFEDVAAHHLDVIRSVHPRGPYILAGWSVGALVAHEMSRMDGDRVETVIGIDGHADDAGTLRAAAEAWRYEIQVRSPWRRMRGALAGFLESEPGGPDFSQVFLANLRALRRYRALPSPSAALMLITGLTAARREQISARLTRLYAGGVELRPTPGRHWTVLDPAHLPELGASINGCLAQRQVATSAGSRG